MAARVLTRFLTANPDLLAKMIWVTGPRQVGKTTLIRSWPQALNLPNDHYLNWDIPEDRKILRGSNLNFFLDKMSRNSGPPFFLLDEIHKNPKWKRFLKGLYDAFGKKARIAVTGSAALGVYRRGGDSLLGRYWLFHLNPLSVAEVLGASQITRLPEEFAVDRSPAVRESYEHLFQRGGFPEPFYSLNERGYRRWADMRREILVREDLRDLSRIVELTSIENLMELLPARVGSPLSLNSLREDLETSHATLKNWLHWLRQLYYLFSIPAYSKKLSRSLKKEEKIYLYDWAEISDPASRFENLVAMHLKKAVEAYREMLGEKMELYYLRDKEKREVDFLVTRAGRAWMLIESKLSQDPSPAHLNYFSTRLKPTHTVLLTHDWTEIGYRQFRETRYWLSPAGAFFSNWV